MNTRCLRQTSWAILLIPLLAAPSCLKSKKPGLPPEVVSVVQTTGHNRVELIKALAKYVESSDTAARNAIFFLVGNMAKHYAVEYAITDSNGNARNFDPLAYVDYQSLIQAWDSLSLLPGGMVYTPRRYTLDRDTIKAELLINTVNLALSTKQLRWSSHLPDSLFLRHVLPYRVANEDLEDWRPVLRQYFATLINDSSLQNAEQAADALIAFIDSAFVQENRYIKNANISLPSQILKDRKASPRDLAIFRVMALRSIGIPATLDYAPWISDSLNTIWFATYYNQDGKWKPLLPKTFDNKLLGDASRIPKIYRRIYHTLDHSLFAIKDIRKTTPPFLGHYDYLDVTNHYLPVRNILYKGPCPDAFIYLAVWNGRHWRAVDWAPCKSDSAMFYNIGESVKHAFVWIEQQDTLSETRLLSIP